MEDSNEKRDKKSHKRRDNKKKKRKHKRSSDSSSDSEEERLKHEKRDKKKKKKKKTKKKRSDDQSSDDTDSSTELLLKLEEEREALKRRRRFEKDRLKTLETPEEKRARRLLKKEIKNQKTKEEMGWDQDYVHYTNDDNPFGDSSLTQIFRWNKKLEKEGLDKLDERELNKLQRQKQNEQRIELEKVKRARIQREKEREDRQAALENEERARENEKFVKWRKDEDEFHLKQARLRSKVRIQDGRSKPIDLLAKYISAEDDELDAIEMHEPYTYLNGLTVTDLEDLVVDIGVYQEIDLDKNQDFWNDITVIVQDELHKLKKLCKDRQDRDRRQGVNEAVAEDVQRVFSDKSADQLSSLKDNIEKKLQRGGEGIDVGYWESLLSQLKAHLARARLRDRHSDNLKKKLQVLKAEQAAASKANDDDDDDDDDDHDDDVKKNKGDDVQETDLMRSALDDYKKGAYSPCYFKESDLVGTVVVSEEEDAQRRLLNQETALNGIGTDSMTAEERKLLRNVAADADNGNDEAHFAVESVLEQSYEWSDKYRPRKPRYFNRVHTGFEWNKYNQTHYDVDNPPPKIVQGYKFNIFYPDLIDKSATPTYTLKPCPENRDFCILRIHVGPPYEDIAFKIVNREWEYGYKRGFKCQFHNNIFQLWFHFKRLRYRR